MSATPEKGLNMNTEKTQVALDLSKPFSTRDGRQVEIYRTDAPGKIKAGEGEGL